MAKMGLKKISFRGYRLPEAECVKKGATCLEAHSDCALQ